MSQTMVAGLELYLHIPFCVKKCRYCDFLSFSEGGETRRRYVEKLLEEIRACGKRPGMEQRKVSSVFIGGGTPSLLEPGQVEEILGTIREVFLLDASAEITMEANPGAWFPGAAGRWRKAGVNRLSLGLQSVHEEELRCLGRIHTYEEFLTCFQEAREQGFFNINVDLMSALPGQSEESWKDTLARTAALEPEHISAYSLIIEEGTPFYETYGAMSADLENYGEFEAIPARRRTRYEGMLRLPGEETDRRMYHWTKSFLAEQGYERYEISNYARPGFACRHNCGYWTGTEYLGLGLGASSLLGQRRFRVTGALETYLNLSPEAFFSGDQYEEESGLSRREQMEEFMFLGLRLTEGVCRKEFESRFGCSLESVYGAQLLALKGEGLLAEGPEGQIFLTEYGLDVSNYALARFIGDSGPWY